MRADEARKQSKMARNAMIVEELEDIYMEIEEYVDTGPDEDDYYIKVTVLSKAAVDELIINGYRVTYQDSQFIISWKPSCEKI